MSDEPTDAEVLSEAIRARVEGVRVAIPARVEAYDVSKQTVDVKVMVKDVFVDADGNREVESVTVLSDVPVLWPRAGEWFVTMPLAKGDFVQLLVNDRELAGWRAKGGETEPSDLRMHDLSNAVAIPGVYPASAPIADAHAENMVMGKVGGAQIHLKPNGEVHLSEETAADFVALAALVKSEIEDLRNTVDALVTVFNGHTHAVATTGSASAQTGTAAVTLTQAGAPAAVGDVAAEKVKAT